MDIQELLPLLPGMSLALPPGGSATDLVLLRALHEPLSAENQAAVRNSFSLVEHLVSADVLPVLETEVGDASVRAAYPWRDGLPLAGALARAREAGVQPSLAVAGRLILDALAGLAALHDHLSADGEPAPLHHGAFRADSLWLGFDGRMQLSDAGFSMACSLAEQPAYALRHPRADVHAAGILMHVILTGMMPAPGSAGGHDPRRMRPDVPAALAAVVEDATQFSPADRPPSASALRSRFAEALATCGGPAQPASVSRWLCTLFPANHPLVGALRRVLAPLGGGTGLPINEGPILSNPRLQPISTPGTAQPVPAAFVDDMPVTSPGGNVPDLPVPPRADAPTAEAQVPQLITASAASAPPARASRSDLPLQRSTSSARNPVVTAGDAMVPPPPAAPPPPVRSSGSSLPVQPSPPAPQEAAPPPAAGVEAGLARASKTDLPVQRTPSSARNPVVDAAASPAPAPPHSQAGLPTLRSTSSPRNPVVDSAPAQASGPRQSQTGVPTLRSTSSARNPAVLADRAAPPGALGTPAAVAAAPSEGLTAPSQSPPPRPSRSDLEARRRPALDEDDGADELDLEPRRRRQGGGIPSGVWVLAGVGLGVAAAVLVPRALTPAATPAPVATAQPPGSTTASLEAAPQAPARRPLPQAASAPRPEPRPEPRASPARPPQATPRPAGGYTGKDAATLKLQVTPWAVVFVDGKKVGRTPLPPLKLSPGHHVIRLDKPDWNISRTEQVDMAEGMDGTLSVTFTGP